MKKQTGIWIDSSEAIIVTFINAEHTIKKVTSQTGNRYNQDESESGSWMGGQHLNDEKKISERQKHQLQQFFNEILLLINDTEELYLFGPADTKLKFEKKLNSEKHISIKLVKTETTDSMTENQIVAKVKSYIT